MDKIIRGLLLIVIIQLFSCNGEEIKKDQVNDCLCEVDTTYIQDSMKMYDCYYGNSLITVKHPIGNDTLEITRYYQIENKWAVQEYLVMVGNNIIYPLLARYCQVKDTFNYYKLTFVEDETKNDGREFPVASNYKYIGFLNIEAIISGDTLNSSSESILIPKERLNGEIKLRKLSKIFYNGKENIKGAYIIIDAEVVKKVGDLNKQYFSVLNNCIPNNIRN